MEIKVVEIEKPEPINFILGQSHFIKTVEDLHEALVNSVPGIKFGLAFCEASGKFLASGPRPITMGKGVSVLSLPVGTIFYIKFSFYYTKFLA